MLKSSNDLGIIYYQQQHSWHDLLLISIKSLLSALRRRHPCLAAHQGAFYLQIVLLEHWPILLLAQTPEYWKYTVRWGFGWWYLRFAHGVICEDNVFPFGVCGTASVNILCHTLIKNICTSIFLSINFAFLAAYGLNLLLEQFQPVAS